MPCWKVSYEWVSQKSARKWTFSSSFLFLFIIDWATCSKWPQLCWKSFKNKRELCLCKGNDYHWLQQLPVSALTALVWGETVFKSSFECIRDTLRPPEIASTVYWEVKIVDHAAIQFTCHVFNSKMVIKHLFFSLLVLWFWLHTRTFWLLCLITREILYVYWMQSLTHTLVSGNTGCATWANPWILL